MEPSKPPSDIGAPSKASSDIGCPKANSDIGVSTQSIRKRDPDTATRRSDNGNQVQRQSHAAKTNVEARSRSDSVDRKLAKADPEVPVEDAPRVEQARVAAKRGKLARSASSPNACPRNFDTRDRPLAGPRKVGEGASGASRTAFNPERLSSASERSEVRVGGSKRDISINADVASNFSDGTKNRIRSAATGQASRICRKSRLLTGSQWGSYRETADANRSIYDERFARENGRVGKKSITMRTSENFNGLLKSNTDNVCDTLRGKRDPKLTHSVSFQNNARETELTSSFIEKSRFVASRSLGSRYSKTPGRLETAAHFARLDRLDTTECHASPVVSSENRETRDSAQRYAESNLSPPPLSTLQIFAISTRPLDIQTMSADSVPDDIGGLPSLPVINHIESKSEERKLSILEPPPPGLVSRQESNESWNRFLVRLNSILESRVGEFV